MLTFSSLKNQSDKSKENSGEKNQGGVLGGLGYVSAGLAAGIGSVGEGIIDLLLAGGGLLTGNVDYAKHVFKDNTVGNWFADVTEDFNPGTGWEFWGNVTHGLGQSSVFLLNLIPGLGQLGTAAFFAGVGSQGISSAAATTGDVGFKEVAYGVASGAVEGALEKAFGGMGKAVKALGGSTMKNITKTAVRKGLVGQILSDAAGEFGEEFASEYIDTFLQRGFQIDPNKQYSFKDALYAGAVGFTSGAVSAGSANVLKAIGNERVGDRIVKSGNSQTLVNTATKVADKLAAQGTNWDRAGEWVKALRGQVDAYNKLSEGERTGMRGKTILGEMKSSLFFAETQSTFDLVKKSIQDSDEQTRATFAEYINRSVEKGKRNGKDYTAADIAKDTDGVAWQLAIYKFVPSLFDLDGAIADIEQEQAIADFVAEKQGAMKRDVVDTEIASAAAGAPAMNTPHQSAEQTASPRGEALAAEGARLATVKAEKYSLDETVDGRNVAVVDDDILSGIYTGTWDKATSEKAKKAAKTALLKFKDGIAVKGITARVNKTSRDEYARSNYSEALRRHDGEAYADKMRAASVADDVVVAATNWSRDGGLTHPRKDDFVDFDRGQTLILSGKNKYSATVVLGITADGEYVFYDVEDIAPAQFDIKKDEAPPAVTPDKPFDAILRDSNGDIITQPEGKVNPEMKENVSKGATDEKGKNLRSEAVGVKAEETGANNVESASATAEATAEVAKSVDGEVDLEKAKRDAERMIAWEKKSAPTTSELNTLRDYVNDFDYLPKDRQMAILRMVRSSNGVDQKTVKGVANLMAITNKKGQVLAPDLEFRFADGLGDKRGIKVSIGDKTLALLNSDADHKDTIRGSIVHEIVHYLENRKGYKALAEYARKIAKPELVEKIKKDYGTYYAAKYAKEERASDPKASLDEITERVRERMQTEEYEALIDSEITAKVVGNALNSEKFLKRYAQVGEEKGILKTAARFIKGIFNSTKDKDENLSREAQKLMTLIDGALASEVEGEQKSGEKYALPSKKDPTKLDPRTVTREDVYQMLKDAKDGKYDNNTYIPVRISTPAIVIQRAKEKLGITVPNHPLVMSVSKAVNAMERKGTDDDGLPNSLDPEEIISVIEATSDPLYIVYEPANEEHSEARYVEVVKFNLSNNRKAFAVLELAGENKDSVYINGYEGGEYNVFLTVYPPRSDKLKSLLLGKKNVVIYDKKKDFSQRTSSITVPSVLNDPSFFDNSIHQNDPNVNTSGKNILSPADEKLLFDDDFYGKYQYESKERITDTLDELEMLKESEDFRELSDDEAADVNAKIKALRAGYSTLYDYYVESAKKNMLDDYAKNGQKSRTYRMLEEKLKKAEKAGKLYRDVANATPLQNAQFEIIQKTNPMYDEFHTGIRSPKDIKNFGEVVNDPDSFTWGDFTREEAQKALARGSVTVYSSYPIKNGVFVSTSYKQALGYAGNNPDGVHRRTVPIDSVAWINGDEGQYAKVSKWSDEKNDLDPEVEAEIEAKYGSNEFFAAAVRRAYEQDSQGTGDARLTKEQLRESAIEKRKRDFNKVISRAVTIQRQIERMQKQTEGEVDEAKLKKLKKELKTSLGTIGAMQIELRQMGYEVSAEQRRIERLEAQNENQGEQIRTLKQEKRELELAERERRILEMAEKQEKARAAKIAAKQRQEIGKVYSEAEFRRDMQDMMDRGLISQFFGGEYMPHLDKAKNNAIAQYIAIRLNTAGSFEAAKKDGIVSVVTNDILRNMYFIDENGDRKYLHSVLDDDSMAQFKDMLETDIVEILSNAGELNPYAELTRKFRQLEGEYKTKLAKNNEGEAWGKEFPKVVAEAKRMRNFAINKKGMAADGVQEVLKAFATLTDESGRLYSGRVDTVMQAALTFFEAEAMRTNSERGQVDKDNKVADDSMIWNIDPDLKDAIEQFVQMRKGREGELINSEELKLVRDILSGMRVSLERYNKEKIGGKFVDIDRAAGEKIKFMQTDVESKTLTSKLLNSKLGRAFRNAYFYEVLSPATVFESLDGYEIGGLLSTLYRDIRMAAQSAIDMKARLKDPFVKFVDNKDNAWKDEKGHSRSYRQKLNEKKISVDGVNITLGEAINLYMLTKREHAHLGLQEGGFVTYDENGVKVAKIKIPDIEIARNNLYNQFDATDRKFIEMAEDFFNKTASKIKEDADIEIYGYSKNSEGYYVPIVRDHYSRNNGVTDVRQSISNFATVNNKSFTKDLVRNAKPLEGQNILGLIETHADGLADYANLYMPLKAFDRVYNRGVSIDGGEVTTLREQLNEEWNGAHKYFTKLFKDIQGIRDGNSQSMVDKVAGWIRSHWVASVLGANLKVVCTQTTSLGAATQIIDAKYVTKASWIITPGTGFAKGVKEIAERADKYSKTIFSRSFDAGAVKAQGNLDKIGNIAKGASTLIGIQDRKVCIALFHAAEISVEASTGHKVGTEENSVLAAKLVDEAILTTQAMESQAEKSNLQRANSELAKLFSMFTSDSVKNLSHLISNISRYAAHKNRAKNGDARYEAELKKDGKAARRSMRTMLITGVMLGVITQGFKYLYGKEEEDEKKLQDFGIDIVSSTINVFPIASEIIDKLVFDYDMSVNVLDVVNDTLETFGDSFELMGKAMGGEYVSGQAIGKSAINLSKSAFSLFGIPVAPAERTVTGLLRRFSPGTIYGYDSMMYSATYSADLKAAVESGDDALAEHILETIYKNESTGVYSTPELEEVARLYDLGNTSVIPQKIGATVNDVKLDRKQRAQFEKIYGEASAKVNELIRSEYYAELDDEQRAKAIKTLYSLYYNRAAAEVAGVEWSNAQAYSRLTDNYAALFAAQSYKSGLTPYKTLRGKEVSVKDQFVKYVENLRLNEADKLVVLYANGYRDTATKKKMLAYINSLSISEEEKTRIAERLGFALENGKVVEKKEELEVRAE